MNSIPVSQVPEDLLRTPCSPVSSADEAREIILELHRAFQLQPSCLGLAAPQIGISKAVGIIRDREHGNSIDLINPTITSREEEFVSDYEGCMSFPRRRFKVPRFRQISLEFDRIWMPEGDSSPLPVPDPMKGPGGKLVRNQAHYGMHHPIQVGGGLIVVAIQHEIDHINGICLPWKVGAEEVPYISEGIQSKSEKVGRNDPCPCGRKKNGNPVKYKKCCLLRQK